MEEEIRVCDHCGEEVVDNDYEVVDGQILCRDCIEEHCTTCDHCGETLWINDAVQDDDTTLCETCYNDYYHRCECCNRIIHDNNINWRGDYPYEAIKKGGTAVEVVPLIFFAPRSVPAYCQITGYFRKSCLSHCRTVSRGKRGIQYILFH